MTAGPDATAPGPGVKDEDEGRTMSGSGTPDSASAPTGTGTPDSVPATGAPERALLPTASGAQTLSVVRGLLRRHRLLAATSLTVLVAGTGVGLLTARCSAGSWTWSSTAAARPR